MRWRVSWRNGLTPNEISDICVPPITSVDPHCYEIGALSAQRIIERLSDAPDDNTNRQTVLEPGLLVRMSTA